MRSAIIACALLLSACAAPNASKSAASLQSTLTRACQNLEAQRADARQIQSCWGELQTAQARNASSRARIMAMVDTPQPALTLPTYSSAWQSVAPPPAAPSSLPIDNLSSMMPEPPPAQTWGQTRCDVVIPPAFWDMPTTYRHPLIPAGC